MSKFRKNNTKKALLFTLAFAVIIAGALAVTLLTDWNPLGNLVGPTQEDPGKTEPENPQPDNMVDVEPNDPEPELPVAHRLSYPSLNHRTSSLRVIAIGDGQ